MTSGYKKPGILRASFDYQDLAAIAVLIDFYRQPDVYQWIELDSDDPAHASIDDIVACRQDGRYEVTQVKFTVAPGDPANLLSWDWLLDKKGRAKSLLQKWASTVERHANAGLLEKADLFTDRLPSPDFAAVLDNGQVILDRVPANLTDQIVGQLGSHENAELFFENFRFDHSQPHLTDLEYNLQALLIPSDTDYQGWIALVRAVKEWATLKNRPEPDGRVRYHHIRAMLSRERPRPLPQNFEVPPGYRPPDEDFDSDFAKHILTTDGVTVLWGPPGRGKSTYLSYRFQKLEQAKQLCIRHHYFLNLAERRTTRFFFHEIEQSLVRQIREQRPDIQAKGDNLGVWLDAAAQAAGDNGKRLIVVIDGLDHVWREGRSLDQMQQVFAHLLPARPNMHVVVGTQKIAPKHLPQRLLQYCPEEAWRALPLMSKSAVAHWLGVQYDAGRLLLDNGRKLETTIQALAGAFHTITEGLPLHLIYAFEMLARPGGALTEAAILALPPNPTGDIRDYYRSLWKKVSAGARTILHALASIDFAVAPGGIHRCFQGMPGAPEAIEEIDHLLDHREIGTYPFHGSIFVFVRDQKEHEAVALSQRPTILAWLDGPAPQYWKWAWSWVTRARFGDVTPLLNGPDRPWALAALSAGRPLEQIQFIMQQAEILAFDTLDFARVTELRSLWVRVSNAPEFQTTKFAGFIEATLRLAEDNYRLIQLRSTLARQQPAVMLPLLRALAPEAASVAAESALAEINRRAIESRHDDNAREDWPAILVRILPYLDQFEPRRLKNYGRRLGRSDSLIGETMEEAIFSGRYAMAWSIAGLHRGERCDASLFALACLDGADIRQNRALRGHASKPLFHALYAVRKWPLPRSRPLAINVKQIIPSTNGIEASAAVPPRLQKFFFTVLSAALGGRADRLKLAGLEELEDDWARTVLQEFTDVACAIAGRIDDGDPIPTLREFFEAFDIPRHPSRGYDATVLVRSVGLALRDISIDLQLLRQVSDPTARIEAADLPESDSRLWYDMQWLDRIGSRRLPLHSPGGAAALLDRIAKYLDTTVTEYMERSDTCIDATLFALDHDLLDQGKAFLDRTARCLLGYGWRKDPYAFELLEVMELMAPIDPSWTARTTLELAPAFDAITEYTDGDETNHARSSYFDSVADLLPDRVGPLYGWLVRRDEWYYADSLLSHVVKSLDPAQPHDLALLSTLVESGQLDKDNLRSKYPGQATASLIEYIDRITGYSKPPTPEDRSSSTTVSRTPPRSAPRPADYSPARFGEYRKAVAGAPGYGWQDGAINRWLAHWRRQGKSKEALSALRAVVTGEHFTYEIDKAYDLAFEMSLEVEGREAAFFWLVAAQRFRRGWNRWYASEKEAKRRISRAARHYPDQWAEFLRQSSAPVFDRPGERTTLVFGQSRLVDFLLRVGETGKARELAEAIVATMRAELDGQPLRTPEWAQ
ncbi:NACHT domain-containing protein [Sphingomonas sp.]|uniref:NACHT domain-containing protein n=1 Tax=Sphingomonas sp. TaxID=28214 RepID=UPI0031D38A9E